MASDKIAIKYRPHSTDELLGQEATKKILIKQVATNTVPQAMLFWGIRGTGKTTTARMVAEWINCSNKGDNGPCGECPSCKSIRAGACIDVAEIDAASNNKVEDILNILDNIKTLPIELTKKVVILDEVHNLSKVAFDKLLKTLEEPPEHVVFILCTTERHKVPATILSRVVQHEFRVLDTSTISNHLIEVAKKEGVTLEEEAASILSKEGGGSARDSLTLLQPLLIEDTITSDMVREMYGLSSTEESLTITKALLLGDATILGSYIQEKTLLEIKNILNDLLNNLFNIVYLSLGSEPEGSVSFKEGIKLISNEVDKERVFSVISELSELTEINNSYMIKAKLLLIACNLKDEDSRYDKLAKKVALLESKLESIKTNNIVENVSHNADEISSESIDIQEDVDYNNMTEEDAELMALQANNPFEEPSVNSNIICGGTIELSLNLKGNASDVPITSNVDIVANNMGVAPNMPAIDMSEPISLNDLKNAASNNDESANPEEHFDDFSLDGDIFADFL